MQPINLSASPDIRQLVLCVVFVAAFWCYGRWWQFSTQGLYLPTEYPMPLWVRWLCAEFNISYGLNPYAAIMQLPPLLWLFIAIGIFFIAPSAGVFLVFVFISAVLYLFILWRVNETRAFK
jgi:hypothetical protein